MFRIDYFSHARGALLAGLRAMPNLAGKEVLLPSYVCSVVTDAIERAALTPVFYDVDQALRPLWDSVHANMGPQSGALILIHYFGIAQDSDHALSFCRRHGLLLIEDNAHGFSAERAGQPLGTCGDLGIVSPRKVMDVRNGGLLYIAEHIPPQATQGPAPGLGAWRIKQAIKQGLMLCPPLKQRLKRRPDYLSVDEGREDPNTVHPWSPDPATLRNIKTWDAAQDRARRQACWQVWKRLAEMNALQPLIPQLSSGDSPLCFPVRITDQTARAQWFAWGWQRHLDVHSWPALPQAVIEQQCSGYRHWQEVVCFPIAINMDPKKLRQQLDL